MRTAPSLETPTAPGRITIDAVPVPLNPQDATATAVGEFQYAGGVSLRARGTERLHELSGVILTGANRFAAVGDEGVLLEARLVLDDAGRLTGVTDATLSSLAGPDGEPLTGADSDAEGLALLPTGDRLVSFEERSRIWLYPASGGPPRAVAAPRGGLPSNAGLEALTADPDAGPDAYQVGAEGSGATWTCRVDAQCEDGPAVDKPSEFGLVSMSRLSEGATAYLLRAFDEQQGPRITLQIRRNASTVARLDLARPLTVDNFEGLASEVRPDGRRRFYLISDDNNRPSQRTLLLAFDWQPR